MDFFKDLTHLVTRNQRSAEKQYELYAGEHSKYEWDGDLFHELLMRRTVNDALYQEHGRTVNQMLKTTLESFQ